MASGAHGKKAVIAALFANLGIAVAKLVGFAITRSSSMLAESLHSLADSGNQGLLLYGSAAGNRRPTDEHPFGYGRARYFWAFVVALVLFSLGSLFSLYEGWHKLRDPHELSSPLIAVAILAVAIVIELGSMRIAVQEARKVKRKGESWWAFVRHSKSAELPVVLLEDLGALVGLVVALIGVSLTAITGDPLFDALGTMAIGVLLGVIAVILAIEMQSLLIGEAASPDQVALIRACIASTSGIDGVIHLRTVHLAPEEIVVAAKVAVAPGASMERVSDAIDRAEGAIREAVPEATLIFIEPDMLHEKSSSGTDHPPK
jgi:cation diffusion facilitator family transporter